MLYLEIILHYNKKFCKPLRQGWLMASEDESDVVFIIAESIKKGNKKTENHSFPTRRCGSVSQRDRTAVRTHLKIHRLRTTEAGHIIVPFSRIAVVFASTI